MPSPNNSSPRYYELDALRGVSALAVLCHHYLLEPPRYYFPQKLPEAGIFWANYRIQLFCMLSGFAILMVLERTPKAVDFMVARFSRLYPSYAVVTLLSACLVTVFALPGRQVTGPQVIINLTMLQSWLGVKNVELSYWYLAPELFFYLCMFGLFVFGRLKYAEAFGYLWLSVMILNDNIFGALHLRLPAFVEASFFPEYGHLFFAGMLFYYLKTKGHSWRRHAGIALCFITQNLIFDDMHSVMSMAICLGIFYLFLFGKLSWIAQKPLLFLGSISYCLYLIHENLGYVIIRQLYIMGLDPVWRFVIPTVVVIAVATFLTYGVERPAMAYIRKMYKKRP